MKYKVLMNSGFHGKGDIVDIEILKEHNGIIEYDFANKQGALYNPTVHISSELFYKKFKLADFSPSLSQP